MGTRVVHVVTGDGLLRRALVAHLRQEPHFALAVDGGQDEVVRPSEVVISTTTECPTARCQELTDEGVSVIVLAAIPKPEERARYRSAGARAYIPMTADGLSLVAQIRAAVS